MHKVVFLLIAFVAVVVLAQNSARNKQTYKDVGFGECARDAQGTPAKDQKRITTGVYNTQDCENMCNSNPRCKGYAFNDDGGWKNCYVYFQGPLYPQKYKMNQRGNAQCNIKKSAHPTTGIYAPDYVAVPDFRDIGFGECALSAAGSPVTQKQESKKVFQRDECERQCFNNPQCKGFSFSNNGGWDKCFLYFQGPLYPKKYESQRFGNSRCFIKKSAHPTTGIYASNYKPAPTYQKLGKPGMCSLAPPNDKLPALPSKATGNTMPARTEAITNLMTQNNCLEVCDSRPSCRGFSWHDTGGWRGCFIHYLPVAEPTTQANRPQWSHYECNKKLDGGLLELEESIEAEENIEAEADVESADE